MSRWLRGGIRTQIIVMVLIGAVLTTAVTLLIADASIQGYAIQQAQAQEARNMNVALLVWKRAYGGSISVDYQGDLVIDSPKAGGGNAATDPNFGRLSLKQDTSYVDTVQALLNDVQVSVYQCANAQNQADMASNHELCPRVSTTLQYTSQGNTVREDDTPGHSEALPPAIVQQLGLQATPTGITVTTIDKIYQETIDGVTYLSAYHVMQDPQHHNVGVLSVSEPLTDLNALINRTTVELIVSGVIIMIGGIILALLVASAISGTLQRAATQLSRASTQLTSIADAQAAGSRQQVWAINAINQALQNLQETSNDVSQRTDQLAQIGTQVAMRRAEIAPAQFESIMAYMTRSAGDISVASRHQTTTIDRMASAMEAVVEIADQVSNSSQHTTESAKRLDTVIGELEQLVTGKTKNSRRTQAGQASGSMASGPMGGNALPSGTMAAGSQMPMNNGIPSAANGSRPRQSAPGRMPPGGAPNGPRRMEGDFAGTNAGYGPPAPGRMPPRPAPPVGRPMLPSADRPPGQSRPRTPQQDGWDRSGAPDQGNYPYGYGGQSPWPQRDQGRNNR
jgi:hypothetical protein